MLVVDDEPLIRWSIGERLRAEGYDVIETATGGAAIEAFVSGVDLVLLDHELRDLAGISLMNRLRALDGDVPIILMIADHAARSAHEALAFSSFPHAEKPFRLDDLVVMVRGALERGL